MSRPLRWLYSALLLLVLVFGAPYWLFRMLTSGRYRAGLAERLGRTPRALRGVTAGGRLIWIHAVSVGEVLGAAGLVRGLRAALPGWTIAVSTTTATGQALARRRLGEDPGMNCPVFYLPLDFAVLMRRTLRRLSPRLVVLMESELWPNLLEECARAGVPVVVANARVSDRSFPRYLRLRRLWRPLFQRVGRFLTQGEESAQRLRAIGAMPEQVVTTGNLKYDLQAPVPSAVTEAVRRWLPSGADVLVAGSTLETEEDAVLASWSVVLDARPDARLILAPRHPDRFGRVAALAGERGFRCVRATELKARESEQGETANAGPRHTEVEAEQRARNTVLLLDTVGDLHAVYGLATVAFVGGSLVPAGGHNPLEPAQFGVPVLVGPSTENFREIVSAMRSADGLQVITRESFAAAVLRLMEDPEWAHTLGQRGQSVFAREAGANEQTVRELLRVLETDKNMPVPSAGVIRPGAAKAEAHADTTRTRMTPDGVAVSEEETAAGGRFR